jgi:hypothetical protein
MICFHYLLKCFGFNYVIIILSLLVFAPHPLQVSAHACKQLQHDALTPSLHISLIITNISLDLQSAPSLSASSSAAASSPPSAAATSSACPAPLQLLTIDAKMRLSGLYFDHAPLILHSMQLMISAEVHGSSGSDVFGSNASTESRAITAHGGGGSSRCDASGAREGRDGGRVTCASAEGGLSREEEEKARVDVVVKVRVAVAAAMKAIVPIPFPAQFHSFLFQLQPVSLCLPFPTPPSLILISSTAATASVRCATQPDPSSSPPTCDWSIALSSSAPPIMIADRSSAAADAAAATAMNLQVICAALVVIRRVWFDARDSA